jgi:coproporphyrinogen III oxidase-like Fe-S oxidoreductase
MFETAKEEHKDEKGLLKIYALIKSNRYFSCIDKDTIRQEFERSGLSNPVEILRHYIAEGILAEDEGQIHITTKGIRYIKVLLKKHEIT